MAFIIIQEQSAGTVPTPASGKTALFIDTADGKIKAKKSDGEVTNVGAVSSVAGRTGAVVLTTSDVSGLGTAAAKNVGTGSTNVAAGDVVSSQKGQVNGLASLDGEGKLPSSQLTISALEYKGTYNAATNTPSLSNGSGNAGDQYKVSVSGTHDFGAGSIQFAVGDYVIYSGTAWEKVGGGAVSSVFGRTGIISAEVNDYSIDQIEGAGSAAVGNIGVDVMAQADNRVEALLSRGLGVIEHGSNAETTRGTVFARYIWIGTVFPKKSIQGDMWLNPSGAEVEE